LIFLPIPRTFLVLPTLLIFSSLEELLSELDEELPLLLLLLDEELPLLELLLLDFRYFGFLFTGALFLGGAFVFFFSSELLVPELLELEFLFFLAPCFFLSLSELLLELLDLSLLGFDFYGLLSLLAGVAC
jgi:hypothetical protein